MSFSCEARTAPLFVFYSGTVSAATSGWQYRVNGGSWTSASSSLPTSGVFLYRSVPAFTIDLRPTTPVTAGSTGSVSINVFCASGCGTGTEGYSTVLSATRILPTPTASDLQLACTPTSVTIGAGQPRTVSCTYSGRSTLGIRQITLSRIVVTAPAGWTIASPAGTVSGSILTVTPNTPVSWSATAPVSYTFSFTLTPSCSATTTSQPVPLTSAFAFGTTSNITGASTTVSSARSSASSLVMSVQSSSMTWEQAASFQDVTVDGSLRYRIVASGCSGWSVSVSAGPYVYTGPNNGTSIPASNLQLTNTGSPVVISGTATGVTRVNSTGSMASTRKVLNAASTAGNGTYEQQLDFTLTIPGQSRAGTYQSTITLTSAAAP